MDNNSNIYVIFYKKPFELRLDRVVEQTLLSHRIDTHFPRNPYLVLEHIRIFQEPLFYHRADINFPGVSIRTQFYFPGDPYTSNR